MDRKQLENVCKRLYENSHVDLTDCDLFSSLIKEHFDSTKQTAEFNKFKLHSDSTLKLMKKDELISYIHMLYHNWSVADERAENIKKYSENLQEKVNEWIPVEKGLPEEKERNGELCSDIVLVTVHEFVKDEYYGFSDYTINGEWCIELTTGPFKVIAWMPFPELYRGEKNEK